MKYVNAGNGYKVTFQPEIGQHYLPIDSIIVDENIDYLKIPHINDISDEDFTTKISDDIFSNCDHRFQELFYLNESDKEYIVWKFFICYHGNEPSCWTTQPKVYSFHDWRLQ